MRFLRLNFFSLFPFLTLIDALTLYGGGEGTTSTRTATSGVYTGLPAYDPTVLIAPTPPQPPTAAVDIAIPYDPIAAGYQLSIKQKGNFLGFSIELSVATSLMGQTPQTLKPIFLNYMANIRARAGAGPIIRVGGNTQEDSSIWVDGLPDGGAIDKIKTSEIATDTPIINYSPELLYIMANVTSLVGAEWFFGLSFNESEVLNPTGNVPIAATYAQSILGDSLRGMALGNEPDLYAGHLHRGANWTVSNYTSEFASMRTSIVTEGTLANQAALVGPSVCCLVDTFQLADVLNAGWLQENIDYLSAVTVQHYPNNNCRLSSSPPNGQDIFSDFLNHTSAQGLTSLYLDGSAQALAAGKDIVMLEMNTASCGGFAGLSDSFGAALWMADWALQLAWGNFSAALMHVGGQNVYYNAFTPPPHNLATFEQWTTGSIYYSTLLIAEAFGSSNTSQVIDLLPSADDMYHPAYVVYESGVPVRAVLFNYISDETGASDYQATVSLNGSTIADYVTVRYLRAPTVSEQYNITWAGQTLGNSFTSDGRMIGSVDTVTVNCADGQCVIPVPAPSIALVFLTATALAESNVSETVAETFATTIIGSGSATINPAALETSNGQNPPIGELGSTSEGSANSNSGERHAELQIGLGVLAIAIAFAIGIGRGI